MWHAQQQTIGALLAFFALLFKYFWTESLAIFAGSIKKYSQINYSKIGQKVPIFRTMTLL